MKNSKSGGVQSTINNSWVTVLDKSRVSLLYIALVQYIQKQVEIYQWKNAEEFLYQSGFW